MYIEGNLSITGGVAVESNCDTSYANVSLLLPMNGGNGSTTFTDFSPAPKTLTVNGNAQLSTSQFKWNGSSGYFDGNGDFLSIPGTLPTALQLGSSDFTIEFYVYTTSTATQFICGNLNDNFGTGHYWVIINSPVSGLHTVQFGTQGSFFKFGTTTLTTDAWQYIAITRSGTSLRCFLNGTQLGTTQTLTNFTGTVTNEFRIASAIPGASNSYFLNGYLQDLRITKGTARYTANFTVSASAFPTTSCYTCDSSYSNVSLLLPMNGANASATFNDYSPAPKPITVNGNTAISTTQYQWNGTSGYFDGSGDFLSTPGSTALQMGTGDFTFEGWINSSSTGTFNGPFGQFPSGAVANKWDLKTRFLGANNFIFTYYTGSAYIDIAASPNVNLNDSAWHHVAVTRSGNTIRLFSDGVERRSNSISGSQAIGVSTHTFNVGYNPEDNVYYTGYMNDVRITKGVARYTANYTMPSAPFATYPCNPCDPNFSSVGLLLPMNGLTGSSTFTDFSPTPKTITPFGGAAMSQAQYVWGGSSGYFDGNGDYLTFTGDTSTLLGTSDFCIEFWLRVEGASDQNDQHIIQNRNGANNGLVIIYQRNNKRLNVANETGALTTLTSAINSISDSTWYHIALTRNNGVFRLFINGTNVASQTPSSQNFDSNSWYISRRFASDGFLHYLNGYMDDVRITKGVARYIYNFTPPTTPFPTNGC